VLAFSDNAAPCVGLALLEQLGFAFLHPLETYIPASLSLRRTTPFDLVEEPYWPIRLWHRTCLATARRCMARLLTLHTSLNARVVPAVHTMHPIELTDLLNGFDITTNGTYQARRQQTAVRQISGSG